MSILTPKTHINNRQSMTSLEIAKLTGSEHRSVKRTIERLAEQGIITVSPLVKTSFLDKIGKTQHRSVYIFTGEQGKLDSITVVAQLCPMFTAQLVKRWQELENLVSSGDYRQLQAQNQALKDELLKANNDYKALQVMHDGGLENWQMGMAVGLAQSTVSKKLAKMRKLGLIGERYEVTDNKGQLTLGLGE